MNVVLRALAALVLLTLASCTNWGQTPNSRMAENRGPSPNSQWDAFVEAFITETFIARPHAGVYAGRHEFDGRIADWSPEGLRNEIARLHLARDRVRRFDPAVLSAEQKYERLYVLDAIERDLFWEETMRWKMRNPGAYGWHQDTGWCRPMPGEPPGTL